MVKFAQYLAHGEVAYGVVENDVVYQITTTPFEEFEVTDHTHPLDHVELLSPIYPNKVLAIALNYVSHLGKTGAAPRAQPEKPEPFWKSSGAIIGPDEEIIIPRDAGRVEAEGELVIVIGREGKHIPKADALDYVLGYTCGIDVSARVWQKGDVQWWRAKGSDTFAPLGPFITTDLDPSKLHLTTRVNGEVKQEAPTSDLIFDVPTIVSFISEVITLEAGDVIYTGTPGIPPLIEPGDTVEVEVTEIGILRNSVVSDE
jgi:2-keto-4-pentenoate hydratase/2-oxohepta-3-ene-1,7-dioic acid hydratase in catechol pathway